VAPRIKQLEVEGARAPVPRSWRRQCGGAENARYENDGPRKLQALKMQDLKMTDKSYCKIQPLKKSQAPENDGPHSLTGKCRT